MRPGAEGNRHLVTSIFRGLLDACTTAQNNQVGQRYLLAAGLRAVEVALDALQGFEHFRQLGRLVDFPILLRRQRMRAPLAPPRLSEPRNVDADAQAVETSCETDRPESGSCP